MKNVIIIIFLLMCISNSASAQDLESYLQEAAENNPELKARFNEYLAAMEKVPQVGALPSPELTFGFFTRPMETLMGNQQAELSLMQMFPWFGMLRTQKNEAAIMARGRYEGFRAAKNELFYEVKDTWYQLHQINEEVKIWEENLEILRSIERMALIRFQSGEGAGAASGSMNTAPGSSANQMPANRNAAGGMGGMEKSAPAQGNSRNRAEPMREESVNMAASGSGMAEVLRVQIEIMELESDLESLKDDLIPLSVKFNTLLNRNTSQRIILSDTLLPRNFQSGTTVLLDSILDQNPMYKMLEAEKEAFRFQEEMGRLEGRPMWGAGVNYMIFKPGEEGSMAMNGGANMLMPMIRLSLPIYRKRYRSMIKEAELNQEAISFQELSVQNTLKVQWQESLKELRDIERKVRLYEEQSKLANQALNIMISSYAADGSSFEEILRVQQQLLNYKSKLVNAVANHNTTVARLEMISSSDLDK